MAYVPVVDYAAAVGAFRHAPEPRKTCREIQAYWGEGRIDRPEDRQRALEILEAGLAVLFPLALASR